MIDTCRVEGPMDLDGLNLDDPSFLTAGSDPKETLQDLDTLSNGEPRRGPHRLVKGGARFPPLRASASDIIVRAPASLFAFGSGAALLHVFMERPAVADRQRSESRSTTPEVGTLPPDN